MQDIGFDIISDLYLDPEESFNWEHKATSLYCLVAGNVSSDPRTVQQTLSHLGRFYQGVFYVPGILEYQTADDSIERTQELIALSSRAINVKMLYQNVVIIDGVAIVGINGWNNVVDSMSLDNLIEVALRHEDFNYLYSATSKLQKHLDVKKIIVISNAVPHPALYFKECPEYTNDQIPLHSILAGDTEHKVTHWVFGSYEKTVDTTLEDINYVNNPYIKRSPYYAKRITISV